MFNRAFETSALSSGWSQASSDAVRVTDNSSSLAPLVPANPPGAVASRGEVTSPTSFIVTDPEVAASLNQAIEEADRIRAASGLARYGDVVILVSSDSEGDAVESAIVEFNPLLVANGHPEQRVVRLNALAPGNATTKEDGR